MTEAEIKDRLMVAFDDSADESIRKTAVLSVAAFVLSSFLSNLRRIADAVEKGAQ